jgi:magnesium transporter
MQPLGAEHLDEPIFAHLRRDVVPLDGTVTVGEALDHLRAQQLGETIIYFYAVVAEGRLKGIVPTRRLLMSDPATPVASLMVTNVTTLPTWATVRETCNEFLKHRFLAFPVVDSDGVLHGVADVSLFTREMATLADRQEAEDAFQLIGIHLVSDAGPWTGFRDRFPWLLANVCGGLLAALVTSRYQPLLDGLVVLALFIPVVLALAESVSIQSVTLTLQSLRGVSGTLIPPARPLAKEFATATLLGLACGACVGGVAGVWHGNLLLMAVNTVAITLSMITACMLGIVLPAVLQYLRRDPGIAAGPIVLALTDLATLVFYFHLARLLLS